VFGTALDCNGNRLVNVVVNVSQTTGVNGTRLFEAGVKTYYSAEGMDYAFARRTQLMQTTSFGGYAIANLAPGHHYVQIWGYPTEADVAKGSTALVLLGEEEIVVPTTETGFIVPVYGRAP